MKLNFATTDIIRVAAVEMRKIQCLETLTRFHRDRNPWQRTAISVFELVAGPRKWLLQAGLSKHHVAAAGFLLGGSSLCFLCPAQTGGAALRILPLHGASRESGFADSRRARGTPRRRKRACCAPLAAAQHHQHPVARARPDEAPHPVQAGPPAKVQQRPSPIEAARQIP